MDGKVELSDESQLDELLSAEQYSEMIGEFLKPLILNLGVFI